MIKTPMKVLAFAGGCFVGFGLARAILRRPLGFSFNGKRCLITGGSRGLGLTIARQLVQAGARVAICARTESDVQEAVSQLESADGQVKGFVCDVRDPSAIKSMCDEIIDQWQGIDVLFNVAGVMIAGPYENMTEADFQNSMDINCWGALNVIREVAPTMRALGWGRIVNVASIGGKVVMPHMVPYSVSKFALVGLSNGLRMELAKDGITVTTVLPTIMRTGSPRNATFKGRNHEEYKWFSIGASLPLLSMDGEQAAAQIISACQSGDREVWISNLANPITAAFRWAPNLAAEFVGFANSLLPAPGGRNETPSFGYESESMLSPSFLTRLNDTAAVRNNEHGMRAHSP